MMAYQRVVELDQLWSGDLLAQRVAGIKVVLVRIDDTVHAFEDRCAHLGMELSQGKLEGRVLTCRAHEWQYDVTTGRGVNPARACLRRFAVKIEDGQVLVDVEARSEVAS
jgi:toluene monooxygenase system ferredoxin subunit